MGLFETRSTYKPREYPKADEYWERAQQSHWLPSEVSMAGDINDWKLKLTDTERHVIGNVLKGFVQVEVFVEEYWSRVSKWFKKPEVQALAATLASFESIHSVAYALLNDSLGLDDYQAFLAVPEIKVRIDRMINTPGKTRKEIAKSLAVFSAFNEGVSLFSSFAILMSFQRRNLLKGVGQIVAWSVRDESLHAEIGCWLFRTLVTEYPELLTDEFKKEIYDAARLTVALEDDFIDRVFEQGALVDIDPKDLKVFIRARTNTKLVDLGLKTNWRNLDQAALQRMAWFDFLTAGLTQSDFFAERETSYAKGNINWDLVFEEQA